MLNDTYKRIQVRAQAALQNTSTSTSSADDLLPKIKDWVRKRYNRIMRAYPWEPLVRKHTFATVANTQDYSLRRDVESIISMWDTTNGRQITPKTIQEHIRFTAPVSEVASNVNTGQVKRYIRIGAKSVSALLSTADQVQVLSTDNTNDLTPKVVRITGLVSGVSLAESITLTGTTVANSTNTYDSGSELEVSVGTSDGSLSDIAGAVTVREKTTTANTLSQIAPNERAPMYIWISFDPTPAAVATITVWYKKKWGALTNDNDAPIIGCADEIIEGVLADALREDGQEAAAEAQEAYYRDVVRELWQSQKQRNLIMQAIPDNQDTEPTTERLFYL